MDPQSPSATESARDAKRPRRGRIAVGVIVLAVVGVLVYVLLKPDGDKTSRPPARSVVASFSGRANESTKAFKVRKGWRIEWSHTGKKFAFAIHGDHDFGTVIDQKKPGSGVSSPAVSGTYSLEVTANGPWRIQIVEPA